jgi:hypothetical protein
MIQERQLSTARGRGAISVGQMVAADYMITPNVVFAERRRGAGAALQPGLRPPCQSAPPLLRGLAGSAGFGSAGSDDGHRHRPANAVAEGRAKATDLGGGLGLGIEASEAGGHRNMDWRRRGAFLTRSTSQEQIRAQPPR